MITPKRPDSTIGGDREERHPSSRSRVTWSSKAGAPSS